MKRLWRHTGARFGLAVAALLALVALLAPWLAPDAPGAIHLREQFLSPSWGHWLGTANNGADVLTQLLWGARVSLVVGVTTVTLSMAVGLLLGAWAGWAGGWADELLMRGVDVLLAFPGMLLAIFITAVLGPSLFNVVFALCLTGWTGYARLVRSQVRALKEREFVVAARALGATPARILALHVLPHLAAPLLVQATFGLPGAILSEASLSFLGLGVPPGTPSWGALADEGCQYLLRAPHVALFPGVALGLVVLGFNALGDALRDVLDVKGRSEP